MITIRHIRIFEALCECGCNTTKAAEMLHITQPAVSLAVSELEAYYEVRLFDRIARRLYLSEAGARFLEYVRTITLTFDDMEKAIREWDDKGVIRAGASISIGAKLMPDYTAAFRKTHPETKVRVRINRSDVLESALLKNELDFALMEGIVHDTDLVYEDYMEDSLALIASPEILPHGSVVDREDFIRMDFLLREHGSGTREVFESTLASFSLALPDPVWESLSTAALVHAASAGLGIAVVPRRMVEEQIDSGSVSEIFVDGISFCRKYKIVFHKDKKLTRAAQDFLEICRGYSVNDRIKANA